VPPPLSHGLRKVLPLFFCISPQNSVVSPLLRDYNDLRSRKPYSSLTFQQFLFEPHLASDDRRGTWGKPVSVRKEDWFSQASIRSKSDITTCQVNCFTDIACSVFFKLTGRVFVFKLNALSISCTQLAKRVTLTPIHPWRATGHETACRHQERAGSAWVYDMVVYDILICDHELGFLVTANSSSKWVTGTLVASSLNLQYLTYSSHGILVLKVWPWLLSSLSGSFHSISIEFYPGFAIKSGIV
jgi:hypothetical protein